MGLDTQFKEYWKTIVDTMMDGVIVVDTEGTILSVNGALERITGYPSHELIAQPCTIFDCDMCFSCNAQGEREKNCMLFGKGLVVRRRCQLRRKDGRLIHVLKNATVLKNQAGKVVGGVETLTDITDLMAKERTIQELRGLLSRDEGFEGIIGKSAKMLEVYDLIRNAAVSEAPIIIYGESGTGKEMVANAVHSLGRRSKAPFVKVSCAALNESLLESELFGHVKGAFTGAVRDRRGRFEAAHRGNLFLDEIGDMPLSTQVKLLRVLQEKELERVGDQTPVRIDTRVIAATHRDLAHLVQEGGFREDLYYRLNVIPIRLPPLRERREDIPLLVDQFIKAIRLRTGKSIKGVTEQVLEMLTSYHWPGNVRELVNILEYAFVVCHEELIAPHHLPNLMPDAPGLMHRGRKEREREEREEIMKVLEEARGNKLHAARLLGISRVTLWKLLKKHGISVEAMVKSLAL